MHEANHFSQGAFAIGRQVLGTILVANDLVDKKRRSGEERVVFKIDFEKAYNYVHCGLLFHDLERKGSCL